MKIGDTLKIKGRWGFLMNPEVLVLEIEGDIITIDTLPNSAKGGILSHMNIEKVSRQILESKLT